MEEIKEQLKTLSNETFIDNNQGLINPSANRNFNNALIEAFAEKIKELDRYAIRLMYDYEFVGSVFDGSLEDGDIITLKFRFNAFLIPELKDFNNSSQEFRTYMYKSAFGSNLGVFSGGSNGGGDVIEIRIYKVRDDYYLDADLVISNSNIDRINVKLRSSVLGGMVQIFVIYKG